MIDYKTLCEFVRKHGSVSVRDTQGKVHVLPTGYPDTDELIRNADQFLWDSMWRGRREMEDLLAQSERGLTPGCADCERLEKELIEARDRDRKEEDLDQKYEMPALIAFKDHRVTHQ